MIAFDTNLLVRLLADDDKAQADIAEALMRTNTVFIAEPTQHYYISVLIAWLVRLQIPYSTRS